MDLFAPSEGPGPQRVVCSGSGINPQIQWLSESEQMPTTSISMGADGRVTVTSQLQIPEAEWETGKVFTCEVSDKTLKENTLRKNISFCSGSILHIESSPWKHVCLLIIT